MEAFAHHNVLQIENVEVKSWEFDPGPFLLGFFFLFNYGVNRWLLGFQEF